MAHYQALARKWRPQTFATMVGQAPVLRALVNSLNKQQVHHAYLFTGTRGVGKTSVARILAKCLNCETGVSATPCGQCSACTAISDGCFTDLIEVDAASRSKVEDTRTLLDNVHYVPSQGRFKIYLIDEVHMLSISSFNALLKTLEEPPTHVKFLLATTEPKKLPATILSRCLQFHLRDIAPDDIAQQLQFILAEEGVQDAEPDALALLARAAQRSMRDALSLLEQALAYGEGSITLTDIRAMLALVPIAEAIELLALIVAGKGEELFAKIAALASQSIDFSDVLSQMLSCLQHVALIQCVPQAVAENLANKAALESLAQQCPAEMIQLFYQIALNGRSDLPLAPEQRLGFEMLVLRMLVFFPGNESDGSDDKKVTELDNLTRGRSAAPSRHIEARASPPASSALKSAARQSVDPQPVDQKPTAHKTPRSVPSSTDGAVVAKVADTNGATHDKMTASVKQQWIDMVPHLKLNGIDLAVASHCMASHVTYDKIELVLEHKYAALLNAAHEERIAKAVTDYRGQPCKVKIAVEQHQGETLARKKETQALKQHEQAVKTFDDDEDLQTILQTFSATIDTVEAS